MIDAQAMNAEEMATKNLSIQNLFWIEPNILCLSVNKISMRSFIFGERLRYDNSL